MSGIPAFPRPHSGSTQYAQEGMTLRDYFAAKAMQGIATLLPMAATMNDVIPSHLMIAENSYAIADAMMKAREKNNA